MGKKLQIQEKGEQQKKMPKKKSSQFFLKGNYS
jgi:hypothetical protein